MTDSIKPWRAPNVLFFARFVAGIELSKLRAVVRSRPVLAVCARELRLGDYIIFGTDEAAMGSSEKEYKLRYQGKLADTLEAVIAAIDRDEGFQSAQLFVQKILGDKIRQLAQDGIKYDYKSALQERWQAHNKQIPEAASPIYSVVEELDLAYEKIFEVEVSLSGTPYGRGIGRSKKKAEQQAAKVALDRLGEDEND